jgi:hypothetical protein
VGSAEIRGAGDKAGDGSCAERLFLAMRLLGFFELRTMKVYRMKLARAMRCEIASPAGAVL